MRARETAPRAEAPSADPRPSFCLYMDAVDRTQMACTRTAATHEAWVKAGMRTYIYTGADADVRCSPQVDDGACGRESVCVPRFGPGSDVGRCVPRES